MDMLNWKGIACMTEPENVSWKQEKLTLITDKVMTGAKGVFIERFG